MIPQILAPCHPFIHIESSCAAFLRWWQSGLVFFALVPGTHLCPLLLAFLQDQFVLWLHGFSTYSSPTVLCLFSGSSASSLVFTLEAGWCLLHHIRYLAPHFPSRLSQAAGTAPCSFTMLTNPCSTSWERNSKVPNLQTRLFVATWKYVSRTSIPAVAAGVFSIIPLGGNSPGQTQDQVIVWQTSQMPQKQDTRRHSKTWGSTRLSTRSTGFHCSLLLPMKRGRQRSCAGLSQEPWSSQHSTLLCWACEQPSNRGQATAAHRGTIWWGLLAISAAVFKKFCVKEESLLEDGK